MSKLKRLRSCLQEDTLTATLSFCVHPVVVRGLVYKLVRLYCDDGESIESPSLSADS
jgi:hypothetical protein